MPVSVCGGKTCFFLWKPLRGCDIIKPVSSALLRLEPVGSSVLDPLRQKGSSMNLEELLAYDDIMIQCHDNPDADAIASSFGVYTYLKEKGKAVRLVYSGKQQIHKSNLLLLVQSFSIPIQHVPEKETAALLITVDCQYGQGNVSRLSGKTVAVIDHHQVADPSALPPLKEIHSNYGSCSTIVWKMLLDAGYTVNENRELATALYYGLYTDTGRLQEIFHPMDKDMRDSLKIDKSCIFRFQNANLSLEELRIAGRALMDCGYNYSEKNRFAIVKAEPCDPNILGVISDMLVEVDTVDFCVAFCMQDGGKAKLSIRSCVREIRADELAAFLYRGLGNGGGHARKAGGTLSAGSLQEEARHHYGRPESVVQEILYGRMEAYCRNVEILDTAVCAPDFSGAGPYRKKSVLIGYVPIGEVFEPGTEILVRMLEGEFQVTSKENLYLMIGVENEVYPSKAEAFEKGYEKAEEPWHFEGEYAPTVCDVVTGERRSLVPYVRACHSRDTSAVLAKQLTHRTKLFTRWDRENYMLGLEGDWLVCRKDDPADAYIVKKDIFPKLYEEAVDTLA